VIVAARRAGTTACRRAFPSQNNAARPLAAADESRVLPMQNRRRPALALKAAEWISRPFLYALMLGIVIRAARRPPTGY
jgi:hypothetical protein